MARWIRASPFPFSSPIERSAMRGLATPSARSAKSAPMWAYWTRFSGDESGLAPMSSSTRGPVSVTIWIASAGRSTPGARPSRSTAAAMPAPVWPAVITASARPRLTSSQATRIEASFFSRRAIAGCSCISMTWAAASMVTLAGSLAPANAVMRSGMPTRISSSPGFSAA